jgi:hypothetical protein
MAGPLQSLLGKRGARGFWLGFLAGSAAAVGYILFGRWGRIPLVNQSVPAAPWARLVFAPGLAVGRAVFAELFPGHSLALAKHLAGAAGVLAMGLVGGAAGWFLTALGRR